MIMPPWWKIRSASQNPAPFFACYTINALGCVLKLCARALELNALPTSIVLPGWPPVWSFLRRFFELPAKSFTERREYAILNTGIQFQLNKQIKLGFRVA